VEARLAIVRARAGDFAQARADLDRVDATVAARGGAIDIDRWVTLIRAELAWREGDLALAARCCADVLAVIEPYRAVWWQPLRARLRTRLALVALVGGDERRGRDELAAALDASAGWTDHSALAAVLDACAYYAIRADQARAEPDACPADQAVPDQTGPDQAGRAARLLGAAHAVRGAFDQSSPDAPPSWARAPSTPRTSPRPA
jgi:hypothetical protein